MNLYWPNMYSVKDGMIEKYSTYNACMNITEASKCISTWVANVAVHEYPIISWVDVTNTSTNPHVEQKVEYGAHYYNKKYDSKEVIDEQESIAKFIDNLIDSQMKAGMYDGPQM